MIDLGWGNSVAVRDAFIETYNKSIIAFGPAALSGFNYPKHEGDPELIKITRDVIKQQIDKEYKHVFIVNGATGGCLISMRAYAQMGYDTCITREAPYYVRYPSMIRASGLEHRTDMFAHSFGQSVVLLDLPSNPLGLMDDIEKIDHINAQTPPVILDGVYLNKAYMPPLLVKTVPHDVYVGSYSKLLGINGIRLGWIATDNDLLAERIKELLTSEYCGLSTASQEILKATLPDLNWNLFEAKARINMNNNRGEWCKLEKFFGDTPVTDIGMFYYAPVDKKCKELLEKTGIGYTKGSAMGTDDSFGRFNLGQDRNSIEQAVKAILKADKI